MRTGKGIAVLAVLVSLLVPSQGAAQLYDPTGGSEGLGCVLRGGISDYRPVARRDTYVVLGDRSTRSIARRADRAIRDENYWDFYSRRYELPPRDPAAGGGVLPLQIFITDEDLGGEFGITLGYCDVPPTPSAVILITSRLGDREPEALETVLAHELFHAFSLGEAAPGSVDGWWAEASATWAQMQVARHEGAIATFDRGFLQRPEVPIDLELPDSEFGPHPYGGWRFVEWLSPYLGGDSAVWDFLAATFRRMGAGATGTSALQAELGGHGHDLGEDLGNFWGDRLRPTNPLSGRATNGRTDYFPSEGVPAGAELTETKHVTAKRLGADVVQLKTVAEAHVQRITISAREAPPGTYLWVQNGRDLEDWTGGGSASFCVGGPSPATGASAWPGRIPIAFTNGHLEPDAPTLSHTLDITVSAEECEGLVRDPTAAIDDSPFLELPDRCPDAPLGFPPPDDHTDYYVFAERLKRVVETLGEWTRAAVAEVSRRHLGQRAAGRLLARWVYCSAKRARQIDDEPDSRVQNWRNRWVSLARDAARMYERGQIQDASEFLADAALLYIKIQARCTVQDIATAER